MEPPHLSQPWKKSTSPSCKLKPKTPLHRYLVSCCDQTLSLQTLLPNPIKKLRSFLESVSEIPLFCLNSMDPCRTPKLGDLYRIKKKIGEGSFGTVYLCTDMSDGKEYACKYLDKRRLSEKDYDNVIREIAIMKHLSAWKHPNVVQIKESYEDEKSVSLVMELCSGGDLFDRIRVNKLFTERESAQLVKNIVEGVMFCNPRGVMHRDLKPENLLFATSDEGSEVLKVSGFGLSLFFKPGEIFRAAVGSPCYVAPEVLLQKYGPEIDVWSVGVILYIMLSSAPPFCAGGILNKVKGGTLNLESDPWPDISEGAKDLVSKMLNRDPKKRFTPQQVLDHPWIVNASS